MAFGGAQKNLGPAGLTLVVVREDLLGHALKLCPSAFNYQIVAANASMYNTPPTYAIYIAGLTFQWLKRQVEGDCKGIAALEKRNIDKAERLYTAIDQSQLYFNTIDKNCRSRMNVPFKLRDETRNAAFLEGAAARGLVQLKGHKSVGGLRASMHYCGCTTIGEMQSKAGFVEITSAGVRESHVHDVQITKEAPNYRME